MCLVGRERGGQEVEVMVDRGIVCELINMRARLVVLKFT